MASPTIVWDVSSGLLIGIVCFWTCITLGKMLFVNPKDNDMGTVVSLVICLMLVGGIGVCMLAWSISHLPDAWLALTW
jgi:hypothetical protein